MRKRRKEYFITMNYFYFQNDFTIKCSYKEK